MRYRLGYCSKIKSQSGTFVVEFAVISFILALLIAFCGDLVVRLSTKGKLDRAAYSAVTVIKERTALFDQVDLHLLESDDQSQQFSDLKDIVKGSLVRTLGTSFSAENFGMTLDVIGYSLDGQLMSAISFTLNEDEGISCEPAVAMNTLLSSLQLDSTPSLYRVTLCYQTENWFGELLGKDYGIVSSNAMSVGR